MATANSLIAALIKRAAASSTTSLLSKLAPTISRRMFNDGGSNDPQDDKDEVYVQVHMEIPDLKKKQPHAAALVSVEQNTMIVKEKSSGREIDRKLMDTRVLNGAKGEMDNGMLSLLLPSSSLNDEEVEVEVDENIQVTTRLDEYIEGGFYARVKVPALDNDHYKLSVEQNKMIIKEQAGSASAMVVDLPPNMHWINGTKGEMKDGMWTIWFPEYVQL